MREELSRWPDSFASLCERCEVASWVLRLVTDERVSDVGDEALETALRPARRATQRANLTVLQRLGTALDALAERDIVPIVLKGPAFVEYLYPDFDLRPFRDIDLLVRHDAVQSSVSALTDAGWSLPDEPARSRYFRSSHHLRMDGPGPVNVPLELHWNLAQSPRFGVSVPALFERAIPYECDGRTALRLEDHDAAAHLLLHHFMHYFEWRLKWVVDLERLATRPGFSWSAVVSRLREWDATVAAGAAVMHLRKCVPDIVPAILERELPVATWRVALLRPLRSTHPLELFRNTHRRSVQRYLATVLFERPSQLPGWLLR